MNNYKEPFELSEIIGQLMQEIILLKAETQAQKEIIAVWMSKGQPSFPAKQFPEFYRRCLQSALEQLSTQHTWYEGY